MKALLIVDMQNDFMPGGALPVKEGFVILPTINKLLKLPFSRIVATQDWHPRGHKSFATTHHQVPGVHIDLNGIDQILWPNHCIEGEWGAQFVEGWDLSRVDKIIHKGTNIEIDSYSAFFDNAHLQTTGLHDYLRSEGVTELYIVGVATDYCVKYSVLDALQLNYQVSVIADGCRGVDVKEGDSRESLEEMAKAGAKIINSAALKLQL